MRIRYTLAIAWISLIASACAGAGPGRGAAVLGNTPPTPPPAAGATPAPWGEPPLARAAVPGVYLQQWERAENRATCAPIAPSRLGLREGAAPRAATFSGGWAVAYDLPQLRSAFGVAGAGVSASDPTYDEWPFTRRWADGSTARYGPEGGTGPNELAYLRIAGQGCLYNVWSRLGRAHLELLLDHLRFIAPIRARSYRTRTPLARLRERG